MDVWNTHMEKMTRRTLSPKHLAEREGKNPQTGEMMHIKGKDTVRFKPSRKFVDTLND